MASQRNNHLHPNINVYILHTFPLSIFYGNDKKRIFFFENQEFLNLVIIFIILMTFTIDSRVILWGEISSQSLLRVKGKGSYGAIRYHFPFWDTQAANSSWNNYNNVHYLRPLKMQI